MSEFSDSISIVFPADWPRPSAELPEPHCTLIYLGKISEAQYTKEDVQSVLHRLQIRAPGTIETQGLELFGAEKNMLVVLLNPDKLQEIRDSVERTLAKVGAENGSEFKDYRPHVTLRSDISVPLEEATKEVGEIPKGVSLMAPMLWWGDEKDV